MGSLENTRKKTTFILFRCSLGRFFEVAQIENATRDGLQILCMLLSDELGLLSRSNRKEERRERRA